MDDRSDAGALAEIERACAAAVEAIRQMADPHAAVNAAGRLAAVIREAGSLAAQARAESVRRFQEAEGMSLAELARRLGVSKARANQLVRAAPGTSPADDADRIEPQPVVAAIVTSDLGVLIARRNDGSPPWTFIAGEIEPGESPADAAVREVREETGCAIQAGPLIGRRVHPATGRTMVYMAADVTGSTDVRVGDPHELAEVRWASLAQADELMPGMFAPVHDHLAAALAAPPTDRHQA